MNLNIISPKNTHLIKLCNGETSTKVLIRTPDYVELHGPLVNSDGEKIQGGQQIVYDRHTDLWRYRFAPNHNGTFIADILAKKKKLMQVLILLQYHFKSKQNIFQYKHYRIRKHGNSFMILILK